VVLNIEAQPQQMVAGWPITPMLEAARRFKNSYDDSMTRATDGRAVTPSDIIEMNQATLGLIWATHTMTLQEALDVLGGVESGDGT
jgi:hypothetical protein